MKSEQLVIFNPGSVQCSVKHNVQKVNHKIYFQSYKSYVHSKENTLLRGAVYVKFELYCLYRITFCETKS